MQDPPELIEPNKVMVFEGLHPIYDEKAGILRSLFIGTTGLGLGLRGYEFWGRQALQGLVGPTFKEKAGTPKLCRGFRLKKLMG